MTLAQQFDKIGDAIYEAVNRLIKNDVEATIAKVEKSVLNTQRKLFTVLAASGGIIDSTKAPSYPGIDLPQPTFKDLSTEYAKRRARKRGINTKKISNRGDRFYFYSGTLNRYLKNTGNPLTVFGTPILTFNRPGLFGSSAVYTTTKKGITSNFYDYKGNSRQTFASQNNKLGTILVDLFPNITKRQGKISLGMRMGDYFKSAPTIAYRLDNYHGKHYREFMPQYLKWWINTRGRQAIRGAIQ